MEGTDKRMIRLITGSDERYLPKMEMFLRSVDLNATIPSYLVEVEFAAKLSLENVITVPITAEQNRGSPVESRCIQHGSFLNVIDCDFNDTLIYTDGDMVMQRPFTDDELEWLEMLPINVVACGWNSAPDETLVMEATRLRPIKSLPEATERFGEWIHTKNCYNIGVLAAKKATWEHIYQEYMKMWDEMATWFEHGARQQWLVSYLIGRDLTHEVMPYTFHTHGHYALPEGISIRQGIAYYLDSVILFRHRF
jgi:hypothetical protein